MTKIFFSAVAISIATVTAASANPVLIAASIGQQCNQEVAHANSVAISIRKKSGDSVKIRYKKSKVNKVKNAVFRKAKADHLSRMKTKLAKLSVTVE